MSRINQKELPAIYCRQQTPTIEISYGIAKGLSTKWEENENLKEESFLSEIVKKLFMEQYALITGFKHKSDVIEKMMSWILVDPNGSSLPSKKVYVKFANNSEEVVMDPWMLNDKLVVITPKDWVLQESSFRYVRTPHAQRSHPKSIDKRDRDITHTTLESDPVIRELIEFVSEQRISEEGYASWQGSSDKLLKELNFRFESENRQDVLQSPSWPKSPLALSKRLGRMASELLARGIVIETIRTKSSRLIKIYLQETDD